MRLRWLAVYLEVHLYQADRQKHSFHVFYVLFVLFFQFFSHGFFSPLECTFLRQLIGKIPDVEFYHTGDLDYGGILAIEWSENIAGTLPEGCIQVSLERVDDTTRKITIKGDERLEAALA